MNNKMFLKIMKKNKTNVDFSSTSNLIPNSLKFIKIEDMYCVFYIDESLNKKLVIKEATENKVYSETLKYLNIKLNRHGEIVKQIVH